MSTPQEVYISCCNLVDYLYLLFSLVMPPSCITSIVEHSFTFCYTVMCLILDLLADAPHKYGQAMYDHSNLYWGPKAGVSMSQSKHAYIC